MTYITYCKHDVPWTTCKEGCAVLSQPAESWEEEFDKQFVVVFSNRGQSFPCVHTHGDENRVRPDQIKSFITDLLSCAKEEGRIRRDTTEADITYEKGVEDGCAAERKRILVALPQLRQWLNEDRITEPNKMVTNEELQVFLTRPISNER